jgi:hypothetical protein
MAQTTQGPQPMPDMPNMQGMQGMGGMNCPMMGMGANPWMLGGMALIWILVVVALGLTIAALIKYLKA